MSNDLSVLDQNSEAPEDAPSQKPRARGNPIDSVGPTCMFWAMVVGLSILLGVMFIWGISNLDKIAG